MNSYYTELKPLVDEQVQAWATKRDQLRKEIEAAKKKIADETAAGGRVQQQIGKLKELAGQSLAEGQNSYEKFKTSLRNRTLERDTLLEIVQTLEESVLPRLQEEFTIAEQRLNDSLKAACRARLPVCQQRIDALVEQILAEYDAWLDGWTQICGDFGESFSSGSVDLIPGLKHPRVNDRVLGLIVPLTPEQQIERRKKFQPQPDFVLTAVPLL